MKSDLNCTKTSLVIPMYRRKCRNLHKTRLKYYNQPKNNRLTLNYKKAS